MIEETQAEPSATPVTSPRVDVLREAAAIISGDRDTQYGGPEENFTRIAKIWSVIVGIDFSTEDVAMMMVGLKVARYANHGEFQPDTWRDIAGYAGCGYEVGYLNSARS
jgi:hypothetical protein